MTRACEGRPLSCRRAACRVTRANGWEAQTAMLTRSQVSIGLVACAMTAVVAYARRRRRHHSSTLVSSALVRAARRGDVRAVSACLEARPTLPNARRNRMGDVRSAKPGAGATREHHRSDEASAAAEAEAHSRGAGEEASAAFAEEAAAALAAATIGGHAAIVELLLRAHADPNAPHGVERWTSYHLACVHDQPESLEALVRGGCDEPRVDARGRTGAQLASEFGCEAVLDRLAGPLAALRRERLQAKTDRRKVERAKRVLLATALREEVRQQGRRTRPRGLFLEFGVASGASVNFIAARVPAGCTVHGFDSFEGLPERWRGREGGVNAEAGVGFFDRGGAMPDVASNVRLHVGWFEASLPAFLANEAAVGEVPLPLHVSFLHLDADLYSSTATVLAHLAPAVGVGTVIVFDEWCGYVGWEQHEARAAYIYIYIYIYIHMHIHIHIHISLVLLPGEGVGGVHGDARRRLRMDRSK